MTSSPRAMAHLSPMTCGADDMPETSNRTAVPDRYGVVGHPVAHSRSPEIHQLFAAATGQFLTYERLLAPLDGFEDFALGLRDAGYLGLNVTVPFKLDAAKLADELSPRARLAGAVNTLRFDDDAIFGDNTDGFGFVRDITERLGLSIGNAAILILGAGGSVRGLVGSLLEEKPRWIAVANRTHGRAQEVPAERFDLVINGTSSSLQHDAPPPVDRDAFADCTLAYDLVYSTAPTPFMRLAKDGGARCVSDGLGMLIEQAAESFLVWRGLRPDTAPVFSALRQQLDQQAAGSLK
jgi:shikimate dehydrogenase